MAVLESALVTLGTKMVNFQLKDPKGKKYDGYDLYGKRGLLVVFTCNHCPYALALWPRLVRIAREAAELNVNTVAINPNINPDFPDDAPDKMLRKINQLELNFPYLVDAKQKIARLFCAQCTPDIYLFNSAKELIYHGRVDDNWQDEGNVTKHDLRKAIQNMATGIPVSKEQRPSMGCSIKWL